MLDITFYSKEGSLQCYVEASKDFLLWLADTEFFQIGSERSTLLKIDGEEERLQLVKLGKTNRRKLQFFLLVAISQESYAALEKMGDSPSVKEFQVATYRLRELHELLKCVNNEQYAYLQRT